MCAVALHRGAISASGSAASCSQPACLGRVWPAATLTHVPRVDKHVNVHMVLGSATMLGACPRGRGLYSSTCQLLAAGIKILERRQQTQSNSQATGRLWPIFETNSYMTRSRSQCSRPARRPGAIWSDAASQESLPARPQPPNGEGPTQSLTPSTPQMGHRAHATPQGWGAARTQLKKKAQVRGRFSFHSGAVGGTERVISVVAKGFRSVSTKRILRVLARREQCARSKSSALQQSRTGRCGRLPSLCRLCPCKKEHGDLAKSARRRPPRRGARPTLTPSTPHMGRRAHATPRPMGRGAHAKNWRGARPTLTPSTLQMGRRAHATHQDGARRTRKGIDKKCPKSMS